ncbi:hypothetical protein SAMN05192559_10865 [Halobacillus karajensis]|nr:hypothetical protein SAMN05192559_10865 [Halobacillus karajensis]
MDLLLSLLLIILIVLTTGTHVYFVWKRHQRKMLCAQLGIIGLAIILGVWTIYDPANPSISKWLTTWSPLK